MENVLDIAVISVEELPDDIQHTKERKPDVLKKVTDTKGDTFVLQIEFQVKDEPEMVYRMGEYYLMLERKYNYLLSSLLFFWVRTSLKCLLTLIVNISSLIFRSLRFLNLIITFSSTLTSPKKSSWVFWQISEVKTLTTHQNRYLCVLRKLPKENFR